jgi:hypothetical protein
MRSSPPTFRLPPHWGHDVGDRLSNPPEGLVGSKTEFSVPSSCFCLLQRQFRDQHSTGQTFSLDTGASWISELSAALRCSSFGLSQFSTTARAGCICYSLSACSSSSGVLSFAVIDVTQRQTPGARHQAPENKEGRRDFVAAAFFRFSGAWPWYLFHGSLTTAKLCRSTAAT